MKHPFNPANFHALYVEQDKNLVSWHLYISLAVKGKISTQAKTPITWIWLIQVVSTTCHRPKSLWRKEEFSAAALANPFCASHSVKNSNFGKKKNESRVTDGGAFIKTKTPQYTLFLSYFC